MPIAYPPPLQAFFHAILNNSYGPLLHSLPLTLAHKSYGMPQTGENDEDIAAEDSDDFGGDPSSEDQEDPKPSEKQKQKSKADAAAAASAKPTTTEPANQAGASSTIQHNQGPGPSAEYGASVPVEGKRNEGPTDFNHPASVEPQRIVWLPRDPLGISDVEVRELNAHGVESSNENATISVAGTVDVESHPPGTDPHTIFG